MTRDGFLRGEDNSYVNLLLSWLTPEEAKSFKKELDSQLKRWRFRRLPGETKVIRSVEATCRKLFPELTVTVLQNGLRLDSFGTRGLPWYSGEEFKALLTQRPESHEDFLLSRLSYGGRDGEPGVEIIYGRGPSRLARVRNLHPWGMKVDTPRGVRNFSWEGITAVRVLMSHERVPPKLLEFLSVAGEVQTTWGYDFSMGSNWLERYG